MAITKILPVRGQLKGCLDYAANPQKTEYFSTADMQRLIGYTQNKDKTEHQLYVSGFNCMPQNAYCIMQATKQRWGKPLNGGNVGYHIIQSFKPGEATPDQVHEIGCEFARRFLADRFECTVSTHLDKGHLHNHIVVNSVSFMDGRMFRNDFTTYYKGIALLRRSAGRSIAGRVKLPLPIIRSKYRRSQPASESCGGRLPPVLTLRWTARWCRIRCKGRRIGGKTRPVKEYIAAPIDFSFFLI